MTVRNLIRNKGTHAAHVHPNSTIGEVLEALEAEEVGALVVSSDGQKISGIISERDIVRGLRKYGRTLLDVSVTRLMSRDVVTCELSDSISNVFFMMESHGIRHVPVVNKGVLSGIISIRDIVRDRLNEVEHEADSMRSYISSGR